MKLKHLTGDNLKEIEQRLDELGALVSSIVSVTYNKTWYVHFIESEGEKNTEESKVKGVRGASKPKTIQS